LHPQLESSNVRAIERCVAEFSSGLWRSGATNHQGALRANRAAQIGVRRRRGDGCVRGCRVSPKGLLHAE
jgi:hypothetical protein